MSSLSHLNITATQTGRAHQKDSPLSACPQNPYSPLSEIALAYVDASGKIYEQPLADIQESGTLIDPESGDDLELTGWRLTAEERAEQAAERAAGTTTLTPEQAGLVLDALYEKSSDTKRYLMSYEGLHRGPAETDTCCPAHREQYDRRLRERDVLMERKRRIDELLCIFTDTPEA